MLINIKNRLSKNFTNARGWRTNRKIIVIESDDWGSIRMPNKRVRDTFQEAGYNFYSNPYCKYDTLENSEDLTLLFNLLRKYKDRVGNSPIITANTVVANPDFKAIKESGFFKYSYKPFTETLKDYYPDEDVFAIWQEGMKYNIFRPQYHGREHLNVLLWLEGLRNNNKILLEAFESGFWSLPNNLYDENTINLQASYGSNDKEHIDFFKKSIEEGLNLFEEIFNYRSTTFIANNYTWSPLLNQTLKDNGVEFFQGMKYQKIPNNKRIKKIELSANYTGKKNELGQVFMVRNCVFEPSQMPSGFDSVRNCLKDIEYAFLFKKPAIIVSHRLNFVGAISPENRGRNLILFKNLLDQIINKWPDAEFMSSDQLAQFLQNEKQ